MRHGKTAIDISHGQVIYKSFLHNRFQIWRLVTVLHNSILDIAHPSLPFATISCFSFKNTDANNTVGTRRPSVFLPEDFPRVVSKLQKSGDARRKSLLMSNKERNVIQILTVISIMFAICNIPQVVPLSYFFSFITQ